MKDTELYLRTFAAMYVDGYLTEEDEVLAEGLLSESSLFRDLVKEYKEQLSNASAEDDKEREAMLAEIKLDIAGNNVFKPISRPLWLPFLAAASVILLLGVFIYDTSRDFWLVKDYYSPLTGASAGADLKDDCPSESDLELYFQNEEEAYKELIEKLDKGHQTPCVNFYKGMCFIELKEPLKSIPLLLNGIKSENREISQNAEWYLSLAYLKIHDHNKSKELLQKISESTPQHRFREPAKELLIKLNKGSWFNFQLF